MTARPPSRTRLRQGAVVLAVGTLLAAVLWWVGGAEYAWLGYLIAAMTWAGWGPAGAAPVAAGPLASAASSGSGSATSGEPVRLTGLPEGCYDVLPGASRVTVRVRKLRVLTVRAGLDDPSGALVLAGGQVTASVDLAAATFHSGSPRRDVHVLGPDFLDARRHPTLRFTTGPAHAGAQHPDGASAVLVRDRADRLGTRTSTDGSVVQVSGHLEVRGERAPIVWTVTDLTHDPVTHEVRGRATTSVRRSELGMQKLLWLAGDEVDVEVFFVSRKRATR